MNPVNTHSEGDVIKRAEHHAGSSAQEQLARWQLMSNKLSIANAPGASDIAKRILGNMSEVEELRLQILDDIIDYKESTPEFAQLYNLTGSKDPYCQADWLAEKIYEQQRAEAIMGIYTPGKKQVQARFLEHTQAGLAKRGKRVADEYVASGASGVPLSGAVQTYAALMGIFGIRVGAGVAGAAPSREVLPELTAGNLALRGAGRRF